MREYLLKYRGKKKPFHTPPCVKQKYVFGDDGVWVDANTADVLMKINPIMFKKLDSRDEDLEYAEDIKPKPELEVPEFENRDRTEEETELVCKGCGKVYKNKGRGPEFYKEHIEICDEIND